MTGYKTKKRSARKSKAKPAARRNPRKLLGWNRTQGSRTRGYTMQDHGPTTWYEIVKERGSYGATWFSVFRDGERIGQGGSMFFAKKLAEEDAALRDAASSFRDAPRTSEVSVGPRKGTRRNPRGPKGSAVAEAKSLVKRSSTRRNPGSVPEPGSAAYKALVGYPFSVIKIRVMAHYPDDGTREDGWTVQGSDGRQWGVYGTPAEAAKEAREMNRAVESGWRLGLSEDPNWNKPRANPRRGKRGSAVAEMRTLARKNPTAIKVGTLVYDPFGNVGKVLEVPRSRGGAYTVQVADAQGRTMGHGVALLTRGQIRAVPRGEQARARALYVQVYGSR